MYLIGIDLGGTSLAAGVVDMEGRMIASDSVPTGEHSAAAIAAAAASLVKGILARAGIEASDICAIGVGVPGTANRKTGELEYANNLGMENVRFGDYLSPYFPGIPVALENDANAAAYAEYLFGAGRGYGTMVMITLGTGIGAGIIINGELFEGVNFAAGELGHTVIEKDGLPCNCGRRGCFERYASTRALIDRARAAMENDSSSLLWELTGGDADTLDGRKFFAAVRKGDAVANAVLDEFAEYLSLGIVNVINFMQPELIVIGGGISREGEVLLAPVRRRLDSESYSRISKDQTVLTTAALGNDAGIIGAAHLAKKQHE